MNKFLVVATFPLGVIAWVVIARGLSGPAAPLLAFVAGSFLLAWAVGALAILLGGNLPSSDGDGSSLGNWH